MTYEQNGRSSLRFLPLNPTAQHIIATTSENKQAPYRDGCRANGLSVTAAWSSSWSFAEIYGETARNRKNRAV
jgi:hypothetical protein